jgi:hypothetical protein
VAQVPTPAGLLVFDCGGRKVMLADAFDDEVKALSGDTSVPMLGVAGYGEIAKFGGSFEGFHNISAVMVGW